MPSQISEVENDPQVNIDGRVTKVAYRVIFGYEIESAKLAWKLGPLNDSPHQVRLIILLEILK